jgi:hypothetical protein
LKVKLETEQDWWIGRQTHARRCQIVRNQSPQYM